MSARPLMLAALLLLVPLTGCIGGEDDPVPPQEEPVDQLEDWDVYYVQSTDDLPLCGSDTMGRLYYISDVSGFQVCTNLGWAFIDLTGPAGPPGVNGTNGVNGLDGMNGVNGTNGVNGLNGTNGVNGTDGFTALASTTSIPSNASTCVTSNGGIQVEVGLDLDRNGMLDASEVRQTSYICNGLPGANGTDGAQGVPGVNGTDGQDGLTGANGSDGTDGADGLTAMAMTSQIGSGNAACPNGGIQVQVGLDDNSSGILDPVEVDQTTYICNGAPGVNGTDGAPGVPGINGSNGTDGAPGPQGPAGANGSQGPRGEHGTNGTDGADGPQGPQGIPGQNGTDGQDGQHGLTAIAVTTPFNQTSNVSSGCTSNQGVMIQVGLDDNGDGSLNASEIDQTSYVCSGTYGNADQVMLTLIEVDLGEACPFGGRLLHQGLDDGTPQGIAENGLLEQGEVDYTMRICRDPLHVTQLGELGAGGAGGTPMEHFAISMDGALIFDATTDSTGRELFAYDHESASIRLLADIAPGTSGSNPGSTCDEKLNETIFFFDATTSAGKELHAYDSSNGSTWLVQDLNQGSSGSNPGWNMCKAHDGVLYFDATTSSTGREIWAYNHSNLTLWQVTDINSGSGDSDPGAGRVDDVVGTWLVYDAYDGGQDGVELWRTSVLNGTTEQVADHLSGSSSSNPGSYMSRVIGDVLYFDCRRSSGATQELHAYSPSNNSIWLVADVYPSAGQSGNPGNRMSIVVEDLLFFSAFSENGEELWAHNSSNGSTWQVGDIRTGTSSSEPGRYGYALVGEYLYFSADGGTGHELWALHVQPYVENRTCTDCLWQFAELNPISDDSGFEERGMLVHDDVVYFGANRGSTQVNLHAFNPQNTEVGIPGHVFTTDELRMFDVEMVVHEGQILLAAEFNNRGIELHLLGGDGISTIHLA